ncbi:transposase [Nesterenkonia aurantiaca]|uniref:Transposase n=1 Tax=Nesterenkonia aurantiaca TaxID=1436010 RepID=A0A4R7FUT3_9MICC|nr:transposase [Nesterenkonia aurantiaca]
MTASRRRFTQEFKDESCLEVIATSKPIKDVAGAYGVGAETLRNWLRKYRQNHGGTETELTLTERARLKELERENQELRAETAFLKTASLDSGSQRNGLGWGPVVEAFSGSQSRWRTAGSSMLVE